MNALGMMMGLLAAGGTPAQVAPPVSLHRPDVKSVRVIDVHTHPLTLRTAPKVDTLEWIDREIALRLKVMDAANIQKAILLCMGFGNTSPNLEYQHSERAALRFLEKAPDRFVVYTTVDFSRMTAPDFTAGAVRHLEETVRMGARGLKFELGKPTCHWMPLDDPRLDPVYAAAARMNIPIAYHSNDPEEFFYPANRFNRWLYPPGGETGYWNVLDKTVSREQLYRERENMLNKHPNTTFILVHMGWLSRQLPLLSDLIERHPNVYLDVSAALRELGRSPSESAAFLTYYTDRILFGTDAGMGPRDYEGWLGVLQRHFALCESDRRNLPETNPKRFVEGGMHLPAEVLEKIYYQNAEKLLSRPVRLP